MQMHVNGDRNCSQSHGHGPQESQQSLLDSCLKTFEGFENDCEEEQGETKSTEAAD